MLILINILVLFFVLLILYQIFLAYFNKNIIEGLENNTYKEYNLDDPKNALILSQQNAGNISFLKEQVDNLLALQKEVTDISGNVIALQEQVAGLVQSQKDYTTQMVGNKPPVITGAVTSDNTNSILSS
jgi:hypothetical protein